MKKVFLFALIMAMSMTVSAQITWNVKAGGGLSICTGGSDELDMKGKFVGKIGVGIEKPLSTNFSLMPSLELAFKGTKCSAEGYYYDYYDENYYQYSLDETLSPLYIQIPVLGAYRFNLNQDWNLTVKAGPYVAYGISGNYSNSEGDDYGLFSDLDANRFDVGVDIGVDFEYRRFVFGLEFERGFISLVADDGDIDICNQAAYVTIGYKF